MSFKVLFILSVVLILVTGVLGCTGEPSLISQEEFTSLVTPTPSEVSSPIVEGYNPPADVNWLYPSSVNVGNFHYGARAEYTVMVHNGSQDTVIFNISARPADTPSEGFDKAPFAFYDWVTVEPRELRVAPKETGTVLVSLQMSSEYTLPRKWEFWIAVLDNSQVGMLRTELCERWRISMR